VSGQSGSGGQWRQGARRWLAVAAAEARTQLTGPLPGTLVLLAVAAAISMNPTAMIPSVGAGADAPLQINSAFAVAQSFALVSFFLYNFVAALMGGLSILRDRDQGISELLRATPLRAGEYVWGKFAGVLAALLAALAAHAVLLALLLEVVPGWNAGAARGPFVAGHYLAGALAFTAPAMVFSAGVAFAVGARSGQPLLVYAVPTVVFLVTVFVFNAQPLQGLAPAAERAMMLLDPSGLRWLRQTAFATDQGAAFYNAAPVGYDAVFWLGRVLALGVPLALVGSVVRSERRARLAGRSRGRWWFRAARPAPGATALAVAEADADATPGPAPAAASFAPLGDLQMTRKPPGLWRGAGVVLGAELRELRTQPALLLYLALSLALLAEAALTDTVAGAPVAPTAGRLAVQTHAALVFLGCLLLLFTGAESLTRERRTATAPLVHATPLRTASLLLGKALASGVVIAGLVLSCAALALLLVASGGASPLDARPFVLVWGGLLVPTYLVWGAFVVLVAAATGRRVTCLAVGLAVLAASGYHALAGGASWLTSWTLAGSLRWSDLGAFELEARALVLNRLLVLGVAGLLAALAVQLHARRQSDPVRGWARRRPGPLARRALRLAPFAAVPAAVALVLAQEIGDGFQGSAAAARERDYRRVHLLSWQDVAPPAITHAELDLVLEPAARRVRVAGHYEVVNRSAQPVHEMPWTVMVARDGVAWTLDGEPARARERSGLHVLELARPLAPGDSARVGFRYAAEVPAGMPRRNGVVEQFVLPAGVVLHTLRDSFLPVPGFDHGIGLAPADRPEPPRGAAARRTARTRPAAGFPHAFTTRVAVTAPGEYTVNSVGARREVCHDGDRTTVVWESDVPVRALNVVAGRWDVQRRDGAAVFFHPGHGRNVPEMLDALVAARERYGAWFGPYPWPELRLSEFPDRVTLAQGFASNIAFSEGLGFLARGGPDQRLAFAVTAHEAAHQWWGNLVTVADAPGADVLLEGMANYATLLLHEAELGLRGRIAFATQLERQYREGRRVGTERPLLEMVDGGEPGAATVVFDKGAWAFWMLHQYLGGGRMLAGLREFATDHRETAGPYPLLGDLLAALRTRADDAAAFDACVDQWFARIVLPDLRVVAASLRPAGGGRWLVDAEVVNAGSGVVSAAVAVARGTRFPGAAGQPAADYLEVRRTVELPPDTPATISLELGFRPDQLVVDPDAEVLQLAREKAAWAFSPEAR